MIDVRRSKERGYFDFGWLKTFHTFSFGEYRDLRFMGYEKLRVLNEDYVAPGKGFGTHGHRDMEIVTYVISGALAHKDSMGNGSVIKPGDVQRMSAGTGVEHSEFNHSSDEEVHLLQIWFIPDKKGIAPGYEQKFFENEKKKDRLCTLVTPDGRDGSLRMSSSSYFYSSILSQGKRLTAEAKKSWLHVIDGEIEVEGHRLSGGDSASLDNPHISAIRDSHFILIQF